ncbi:hypothetical protein CYMTET_16303 [Cymbomonas tetramitiformis]|uniref:Uncharacterized protein n=1 Tax=Cymbomonas tetramitiformis TaxID=36881 RepID=A0AAE0GCH8_9CHLO|nr:hypothetical protein CYMTET_16303 [Cymbomonas tetramitiformis]
MSSEEGSDRMNEGLAHSVNIGDGVNISGAAGRRWAQRWQEWGASSGHSGSRVDEVFWPGERDWFGAGRSEEPWEEQVDRCSREEVGGTRGRGSGWEQWFARTPAVVRVVKLSMLSFVHQLRREVARAAEEGSALRGMLRVSDYPSLMVPKKMRGLFTECVMVALRRMRVDMDVNA